MLFSIPDQDLALQRLAALGVSQLRLWSSLPLNPATAKVLWLYRVGGQSSCCISNMLIILSVGWWDPLRDWNFARDLLVDTQLTSQAFHLNFTHWVFSPRFLKQDLLEGPPNTNMILSQSEMLLRVHTLDGSRILKSIWNAWLCLFNYSTGVFIWSFINYNNSKLVISDIIDSASQVDVASRWTVKVLWRTLLHASVEKWRGTLSYTWCREKCWKVTWKTWGICAVFVLRVNFVDIFACVKFTCIFLFGLDFTFWRMFVFLLPSTEHKNFQVVHWTCSSTFRVVFLWVDFSHRLWGLAHVCGGVGTGLGAIPWRLEDDLLEVLEAAIFMDSWTVQLAEKKPIEQWKASCSWLPGCLGGCTAQWRMGIIS